MNNGKMRFVLLPALLLMLAGTLLFPGKVSANAADQHLRKPISNVTLTVGLPEQGTYAGDGFPKIETPFNANYHVELTEDGGPLAWWGAINPNDIGTMWEYSVFSRDFYFSFGEKYRLAIRLECDSEYYFTDDAKVELKGGGTLLNVEIDSTSEPGISEMDVIVELEAISHDMNLATITEFDENKPCVYTGKAIKQKPVVKMGSFTLEEGRDYVVLYKNNKDVGFATMIISGRNDYKNDKYLPESVKFVS